MIGNAVEHSVQVRFRVEAIQFGGFNQAVDRSGTLAACV
jgi:hypothetical protein